MVVMVLTLQHSMSVSHPTDSKKNPPSFLHSSFTFLIPFPVMVMYVSLAPNREEEEHESNA